MRFLLAALPLLALSGSVSAAQVDDTAAVALARPRDLIVDASLAPAMVSALLRPVDAFYGFWNNGSEVLIDEALAPTFTDHTLPPGRPQGPGGPVAAGKAFLAAVPDLKVAVMQRLVVGDRVVSHLRFTGHFTGSFSGISGKGEPIDFIVTDILRVAGGRITDNWHLKDNFTFLRQAGLLAKIGG